MVEYIIKLEFTQTSFQFEADFTCHYIVFFEQSVKKVKQLDLSVNELSWLWIDIKYTVITELWYWVSAWVKNSLVLFFIETKFDLLDT